MSLESRNPTVKHHFSQFSSFDIFKGCLKQYKENKTILKLLGYKKIKLYCNCSREIFVTSEGSCPYVRKHVNFKFKDFVFNHLANDYSIIKNQTHYVMSVIEEVYVSAQLHSLWEQRIFSTNTTGFN